MDAFNRQLNCKREDCPSYRQDRGGCLLISTPSSAKEMDLPETSWGSEACETLEQQLSYEGWAGLTRRRERLRREKP